MHQVGFNAEKHHLGTMKEQIQKYVLQGEKVLSELVHGLGEQGIHRKTYTGIVDVYEGVLSVNEIKEEVWTYLSLKNVTDNESYLRYIEEHGELKRVGHYLLTELSDTSMMTLRQMEKGEAFVHIHPARYSPNTFRVKANTLKTAVMVQFLSLCRGADCFEHSLINEARTYLSLSPVPKNTSAIDNTIRKLQ